MAYTNGPFARREKRELRVSLKAQATATILTFRAPTVIGNNFATIGSTSGKSIDYIRVSLREQFDTANNTCEYHGWHLATFHSKADLDKVYSQLCPNFSYDGLYVGGEWKNSSWYWVINDSVIDLNIDLPDGDLDKKLFIRPNGSCPRYKVEGRNGTLERRFICMRDRPLCSHVDNFPFPTSDIVGMPIQKSSAKDCCNACYESFRCIAWTYTVTDQISGMCRLKKGVRSKYFDPNVIPGLVQDARRPDVVCPSNIETKVYLDMPTTSVTWRLPNASDNSGSVHVFGSHEPGSNFSVGVATIFYEAKDPSGNTAYCCFNVTVKAVVRPLFEDANGIQAIASSSEAIKRFGKLSKAIDDLSVVNVSAEEIQLMAQDILQSMNGGIEVLQNATTGSEETYHDSDVLIESVLNAADSLAQFVLRNTEPSSGPLLVETLSIRLNLESDSVEKLSDTSVMMGDGNGFTLPPAEALFPNLSLQTTVYRIVIWLKRSLFQRRNYANDVLSLSFTDREGNELPVNDTKEDISIIFPSDPPRTDTKVLINGVYIEADDITYYRTKANISYVQHATVIHLKSSKEISVNVKANIFKDWGVIDSTEYSCYQFSVDSQLHRGQSSIFIPEHEFPLTGTYKITVALQQKHDVRLSMHVKQIMCGYLDEISGTWNSDGCKVSPASNLTSTVCLCDHLTAFATRTN
ncbi:uncharacterized protein [Ptychodera flava]|uniref:uncharacterized protein n=1 Tax=Ptychodera flava TaxID=63121 RepID=UPI00396A8603